MANFEQLSFLVINRNVNMSRILRNILRGLGTEDVYEAKDDTVAKYTIEATPIDFILFDPVMKGPRPNYEFVKWLRLGPKSPNPHIPVIAVTAACSRANILKAVNNGVDEFISVPVAPIEVMRKVSKIIYKPHPYIRASEYFGPCRRRVKDETYAGAQKRLTTPKPVNGHSLLPPVQIKVA